MCKMSSKRLRQPKKITDTEEENASVALNRERRCWLFEVFSTKDHHIHSLSSEKWPCSKLFNSKWKYDLKVGDVVLLRIAGSEEESTLLKIGAGKELEALKKAPLSFLKRARRAVILAKGHTWRDTKIVSVRKAPVFQRCAMVNRKTKV